MIPTWTTDDLRQWIARNEMTTQVKAAAALSISEQFLSNVLKGRYPVGPRIVAAAMLYEVQRAA